MDPKHVCVVCRKDIVVDGHKFDPCGLILVANADRRFEEQREQTFYCHFECFRKIVDDDGLMYIAENDFATKEEIDTE